MPPFLQFLLDLLKPERLQQILTSWGWLAYVLLIGIVFAETGLLVGFFLPGDSLLFIAGFLCSPAADPANMGHSVLNLSVVIPTLCVAAIVGDSVGFYLGLKTGPVVFKREDSLLFKRKHLIRTQQFFEKYGSKTIVLARFVPIVRTFAPFMAGVGRMNYGRFVFFNVTGGIGWVVSMTLLGYFLGSFEYVKKNLEKAVLLVVFISILPLIIEVIKNWGKPLEELNGDGEVSVEALQKSVDE